jgi:hypothetical protein
VFASHCGDGFMLVGAQFHALGGSTECTDSVMLKIVWRYNLCKRSARNRMRA